MAWMDNRLVMTTVDALPPFFRTDYRPRGPVMRLCVSLDRGDVEAWLEGDPLGADYPEYLRVVGEVARAGRHGDGPEADVVVERWPNVLDAYRRDGLIG